jgi:integrase
MYADLFDEDLDAVAHGHPLHPRHPLHLQIIPGQEANAIGAEGLTPHELRHMCASLAIAGGANVKVLQTLLGHRTATLTLDRYGHLFPDDPGRIADAFDAAAENAADWLRTGPSQRAVPSDGDTL